MPKLLANMKEYISYMHVFDVALSDELIVVYNGTKVMLLAECKYLESHAFVSQL